jgi:hypothetical protein
MSSCWSEGDLRASLDGELETSAAAQLSTHLAECATCEAARQALQQRAARVSARMLALDSPGIEAPIAPILPFVPIRPIPARHTWRNTAALGAIAAGLAIIALTMPHLPASNGTIATQGGGITRPNPVTSPAAPVVPAQRASHTHPRRARPEQRAAVIPSEAPALTPAAEAAETDNGYFLALDDEPIETGIVMRVASPSGDFQADVIVGPDGRAHAIRILSGGN